MALSRQDFLKAARGEPIDIPQAAFGPIRERDETCPDDPDVRRAVDWLKGYMSGAEWERRRNSAFVRLYSAALSIPLDEKGRYFDVSDTLGWYLFLGEAFVDHIWNYEAMYGSRVIPVLTVLGRDLDLLKSVGGVDERVRRIVNSERRQPNGGIFELLVATAYRRAGAKVAFRPETPGTGRTYDLDVELDGVEYAVECKRLEVGEYGDRERARMRSLWSPAADLAASCERSVFGNVDFRVPIFDVPENYLVDKLGDWMSSDLPSILWSDDLSRGVLGELDLEPLQLALETSEISVAGTKLHQLLTGRYVRHASYLQVIRYKHGMSPRYIAECDLVSLLRWQSLSPVSIDAKARDVHRKLAEANEQLPNDRPGIVHIGFEAVEGDEIERARYDKILTSSASFDPRGKPLRWLFCHYLVPESPPDEAWAFDETVQWRRVEPGGGRPPHIPLLVVPGEARSGTHWET